MSNAEHAWIWFVTREADGSHRLYEQELYLDLDGKVCSRCEMWWDDPSSMPLDGDTLRQRIAEGIDRSLGTAGWAGDVIAAGWVGGEEPDWHREHRRERKAGAA